VTRSAKVALKACVLGVLAVLVAGPSPGEGDQSPGLLADEQATETVTPTETPVPTPTQTDTPPLTPGAPTATATPTPTASATVTGTPPTATPPPMPNIAFLFAASSSPPVNQWECAFDLSSSLDFLNASTTLSSLISRDPAALRSLYQVIYVAPGLNSEDYGFLQQLVAASGTIERFVSFGGVAVINVAGAGGDQLGIAPDEVGFSAATEHDSETIEAATHPYITGVGLGGEALGAGDFEGWQPTDLGTLTGWPQDATIVLMNSDGPSWVEYRHGDGRVIVSTLTYCTEGEPSSQQAAARNLLRYSRFFSGSAFTPAPTVTLGPRPTATKSPSSSPTALPTSTATLTPMATVTATPTAVPTTTSTVSATETPTAIASSSPTSSPTNTPGESPTRTPTPSELATLTVTPTETPSATPTVTPASPTPTGTATTIPTPVCAGDCGADGVVTINDLLTMVNISLANGRVSACEAGDANRDGQIAVDEILMAVNNALNGCPGPISSPTVGEGPLRFIRFDTGGLGQGTLTPPPRARAAHRKPRHPPGSEGAA
jgi:hypothetical protein